MFQMSKRRNVKLVEENIRTPVKDFYISKIIFSIL